MNAQCHLLWLGIYQCFILLLCFNSQAKHGGHSLGFLHGILVVTFDWLKLLRWLAAGNPLLVPDMGGTPKWFARPMLCLCCEIFSVCVYKGLEHTACCRRMFNYWQHLLPQTVPAPPYLHSMHAHQNICIPHTAECQHCTLQHWQAQSLVHKGGVGVGVWESSCCWVWVWTSNLLNLSPAWSSLIMPQHEMVYTEECVSGSGQMVEMNISFCMKYV